MKILFVVSDYSHRSDPNMNIMANIIDSLVPSCSEIHIIEQRSSFLRKKTSLSSKTKLYMHYVYLPFRKKINKAFQKYGFCVKNDLSFFEALLRIPFSMFLLFAYKYFKFFNYTNIYSKKICQIVKHYKIENVIAVSNPIYTIEAISNCKNIRNKIGIFFDPFSIIQEDNTKYNHKNLKLEMELFGSLKHILIADYILPSYIGTPLNEYNFKIQEFKLPNLYIHECKSILRFAFDKTKINLIFVGGLYKEIRNPKYLLDLMFFLPNEYILHIAGSGLENMLVEYKRNLGERLCLHGKVSSDYANCLIEDADFLVNIGNTVRNQVPSKLIDYISFGKPIINLYKVQNCKTLEYTTKYGLAINIEENYAKISCDSTTITEFCKNNINKKVEYNFVENLFKDHAPENMVNLIKKYCGDLNG